MLQCTHIIGNSVPPDCLKKSHPLHSISFSPQGALSGWPDFVYLIITLVTFDWLIPDKVLRLQIVLFHPAAIQLPAQADGGSGSAVSQRPDHTVAHVYDMGRSQSAYHVSAEHEGPAGHARLVLGFLHQPECCWLPNQVSHDHLALLHFWLIILLISFALLGLSSFSLREWFKFIGCHREQLS